ncbi:MAG: hypothetical protein U0835_23230 [Isosphaeraceae bacterium]
MQIRIGDDDGLRVEVVEGLNPEDDVIVDTNGVMGGLPVRPERSAPTTRAE